MNSDKIREVVAALKSDIDNIFTGNMSAAKKFMCVRTCELFLTGNNKQISILKDLLQDANESPLAANYLKKINEIQAPQVKDGESQSNAEGAVIGEKAEAVKENKDCEIDNRKQEYEIHPCCLFFPEMQPEEFESLKEDIRINKGLKVPIAINGNKIIDGRHRLRACRELGIEPIFKEIQGNPGELSISLNLHRNLTSSQKAAVAVEFLKEIENEAKERLKTSTGDASLQPVPNLVQAEKGRACVILAKRFCVSSGYIIEAKSIREKHPDKFEELKSGKKTIQCIKKETSPVPPQKPKLVDGLLLTSFEDLLQLISDKDGLEKILDATTGKARDLIRARLDVMTSSEYASSRKEAA